MGEEGSFYSVGGTLGATAASYIARHSDETLYQTLKGGEYCYVLTSRQMGKSSLMSRTRQRLAQDGILSLTLDLGRIGKDANSITPERWYNGLFTLLGNQRRLYEELEPFLKNHQELTLLQRWTEALRHVVLAKFPQQPLVIFIDEIDVTQSLPFPMDDFFAGIRECYNRRAEDTEFQRLTFCLLGVVSPCDLIKDARVTPFNIGKNIYLSDFNAQEILSLAQGLPCEPALASRLIQRVYYWSGGHPYLTQCFCRELAENPELFTEKGVDKLCYSLFLESRSKESDHNLGAVSNHLLGNRDLRADILSLYQKILKNQKVLDDNANPLINKLLLSGLVKIEQHCLKVRNRIYAQAFNLQWIDSNMPDTEKRRQESARQLGFWQATAIATTAVMLLGSWVFWYWDSYIGIFVAMMLVLVGGGVWYWDSYIREVTTYWNTYVTRFGIPHGVGQLKKSQLEGRSVTYRFLQKGRKKSAWKVQAIGADFQFTTSHNISTYFNYASRHVESTQKEVEWEFILDTNGRIVYEKAFDRDRKMLWGLVYSPPLTGYAINAHYVGEDGYPRPQFNTNAEFVEITYSTDGYEIAIRYFDRKHQPQARSDGVHLIGYKVNIDGFTVETTYLNVESQPTFNEHGTHRLFCERDTKGNITGGAYFGISGEPIVGGDGYIHKWTYQHDQYGNEIKCAHFGISGEPVLCSEGVHLWTIQYNTQGKPIEYAYFGVKGEPVFLVHNGKHKCTAQYDNRNNIIGRSHSGRKGELGSFYRNGMHKWINKYDAYGNIIECARFGSDKEPILYKDGIHKWIAQYNNQGKQIECIHLGLESEPIIDKYGIHKWTTSYDNQGNAIERSYFDTQGQTIRTQLTVISVNDNSSLEVNDILLSYDNQILTNNVIYRNLKAKTTTPAKKLQILRAGKPLSLLIKLKELDVELEDIAC